MQASCRWERAAWQRCVWGGGVFGRCVEHQKLQGFAASDAVPDCACRPVVRRRSTVFCRPKEHGFSPPYPSGLPICWAAGRAAVAEVGNSAAVGTRMFFGLRTLDLSDRGLQPIIAHLRHLLAGARIARHDNDQRHSRRRRSCSFRCLAIRRLTMDGRNSFSHSTNCISLLGPTWCVGAQRSRRRGRLRWQALRL
jgi:hypothetical protein